MFLLDGSYGKMNFFPQLIAIRMSCGTGIFVWLKTAVLSNVTCGGLCCCSISASCWLRVLSKMRSRFPSSLVYVSFNRKCCSVIFSLFIAFALVDIQRFICLNELEFRFLSTHLIQFNLASRYASSLVWLMVWDISSS